MAFQYVETIIDNGHYYVIQYDPETAQVRTNVAGIAPDSEPDTPLTLDSIVTTFCNGTTLHVVRELTYFPYIYSEQVAESPECGYVPIIDPPPPPDEPEVYTLVYRMTFSNPEHREKYLENPNVEEEVITIYIADKLSIKTGFWETNYIDIEPAGDPFHLSTIDNEESKLSPIKATQATLRFLSTNQVNLNTFIDGTDDRWKVNIVAGNSDIFSGFLVIDDMDEDFNFVPNEVTLVAIDGLGTLKDVPLTKPDGSTPRWTEESEGKYKIIEFIAWALQKTGLKLDIMLADNLFEESYPNLPAFDNIYLDAKTFEGNEIGVCEDCYSVLEKILTDGYFIKQWRNQWWILRQDEYETRTFSYFRFDYDGVYQNRLGGLELNRLIAQGEEYSLFNIEHVDDGTYVKGQRKYKEIKESFNYEYPLEIVDNINFARGKWLSPVIVPPKTVENVSWDGQAFNLDDWTITNTIKPTTAHADIRRYFYDDDEKERYMRVTPADSSATPWDYVKAHPIPVHQMDKVTLSVNFRLEENVTGGAKQGQYIFTIYLISDAGRVFMYEQDTKSWKDFPSLTGLNFGTLHEWDSATIDESFEWQTHAIELPPFPRSGDLTIGLFNGRTWSSDARTIHYANLQVNYQPYINASYSEYTGQYHRVYSTDDFKAKREQVVYLSDSPKKLFKGALWKRNELGKFILAGKWYNGAVFPDGVPDAIYLHSRGRTQAFEVWNQHNRTFIIIDAQLQGLETTSDIVNNGLPDLVHKWVMGDASVNTNNKYFLLLHYDMDFYKCEWKGYFVEVFDTTKEKEYSAPYEFKYIRNNR